MRFNYVCVERFTLPVHIERMVACVRANMSARRTYEF